MEVTRVRGRGPLRDPGFAGAVTVGAGPLASAIRVGIDISGATPSETPDFVPLVNLLSVFLFSVQTPFVRS